MHASGSPSVDGRRANLRYELLNSAAPELTPSSYIQRETRCLC